MIRRFLEWAVRGRTSRLMRRPFAVVTIADGGLAVADPDAHAVHLFDTARNRYKRITRAGREPLLSPVGLASDGNGRLYVSDSMARRVSVFSDGGKWRGDLDLPPLGRPTGLAYDRTHRFLWIVDTAEHHLIRFEPATGEARIIGRRGTGPGEFNYPVSVAVDRAGTVYVGDSMNFRIQVLGPEGRFLGAFGEPGTVAGRFDKIKGVAVDSEGHIYVVDALHDVIQIFDRRGSLLTVVGGSGTGPGEFWLPAGIHIDDDRIFVADSANHRLQILTFLGDRGTENDLG
ncbi:MAG: 6-bladed beta-propeller [Acidobacteria bacterium]|nr:MAG: 6-bladed beta-propeller [Acidobacteriota bacterium]